MVRLIEVGQSAGSTTALPAAVLGSSGPEIYRSGAGAIPVGRIFEAPPEFISRAAGGEFCIDLVRALLAQDEDAWPRDHTFHTLG